MNLKFVTALLVCVPAIGAGDAYDSLVRRYEREIAQQSRQLKMLRARLAQNEKDAQRAQARAEAAQSRWSTLTRQADVARSEADSSREAWVVTRNLAESVEWEAVRHQLVAQSAQEQVEQLVREVEARSRIARQPALTVRDRSSEYLAEGLGELGAEALTLSQAAAQEEVRLRLKELHLKNLESSRRQQWITLRREQQQTYAEWQRSLRIKAALEDENQQMEQSAQALQVMLRNLREDKDRALAFRQEDHRGGQDPALSALKGTLPWPAEGRVIQSFGRQQSRELQQLVISNGIKIQTPPGKSVRAVQPGKVIFAAPFRRYGRMVIVQHAHGLASVYAGLGDAVVREGVQVATLDALGSVGESGSFYFELRRDERPVNPIVYLSPPERVRDISSRRTY